MTSMAAHRRVLEQLATPEEIARMHQVAIQVHAEAVGGTPILERDLWRRVLGPDGMGMTEEAAAAAVDRALSEPMPADLAARLLAAMD